MSNLEKKWEAYMAEHCPDCETASDYKLYGIILCAEAMAAHPVKITLSGINEKNLSDICGDIINGLQNRGWTETTLERPLPTDVMIKDTYSRGEHPLCTPCRKDLEEIERERIEAAREAHYDNKFMRRRGE